MENLILTGQIDGNSGGGKQRVTYLMDWFKWMVQQGWGEITKRKLRLRPESMQHIKEYLRVRCATGHVFVFNIVRNIGVFEFSFFPFKYCLLKVKVPI